MKDNIKESVVHLPLVDITGFVCLRRFSKRRFDRCIYINDNASKEDAAKVIDWARRFRRKLFIERIMINTK